MAKKEEKLQEKETQDTAEISAEPKAEAIENDVVEKEAEIAEDNLNGSENVDESQDIQIEVEPKPELEQESNDSVSTFDFNSEKQVTVQPVKFGSFEDSSQTQGEINKNLDILMDIKLQLTVELGRTELPIRKVLELTRGSIIELEKIAGEPVELFANGKLVAHGEVVVIEDNFGLRITSITDPEDRLKGI